MVSTFSMLNYGPQRRYKCHKTLSCNFFGVIQQFDSTRLQTVAKLYINPSIYSVRHNDVVHCVSPCLS